MRAQEWALQAIHAQKAWQTTKGEGVTVAVLDTGVDANHADLAGKVEPEGPGRLRSRPRGRRLGPARHRNGQHHRRSRPWCGPRGRCAGPRPGRPDPARPGDPGGRRPRARQARRKGGNALADGIRWAADHGADVINISLGDDSESAHPEPARGRRHPVRPAARASPSSPPRATAERRATTSPTPPPTRASSRRPPSTHGGRAPSPPAAGTPRSAPPATTSSSPTPTASYYEGWGTSAAAAFVSGAVALVRPPTRT